MSALANEFEPGDDQAAIRDGVRSVVTRFGDDYWLARDDDGKFPFEFHRAMADAGWLGIIIWRLRPRRNRGRDHDA
jgi:acyl-CoA dehydrogenase